MLLSHSPMPLCTFCRLLYGDYMIPGADPKLYEEVKDLVALVPTIEEYLSDYNAESKTPMKLVMFLDAIEHVSRISRVLRQPQVRPSHGTLVVGTHLSRLHVVGFSGPWGTCTVSSTCLRMVPAGYRATHCSSAWAAPVGSP